MKKFLSIVLAISMLLCTAGTISANGDVKVYLNNQELVFDQPPIIQEGRTLVPMRAIFEALGASVEWNGETRTIKASKDTNNIVIEIGNPTVYVNGELLTLDVPATILNDRTLVPLRFISESLDCEVEWVDFSRSVYITSNDYVEQVENAQTDVVYYEGFYNIPALKGVLLDSYSEGLSSNGYYTEVYMYDQNTVTEQDLAEYKKTLIGHGYVADGVTVTGSEFYSHSEGGELVMISQGAAVIVFVGVKVSHYSDYPKVPDFGTVVAEFDFIESVREGSGTVSYRYKYEDDFSDPSYEYVYVLTNLGFEEIESQKGISFVKEDVMVNLFADSTTKIFYVTVDELVEISSMANNTYDSGVSSGYNMIGDVLVYDVEFPLHLYGQDLNRTYLGKLTTNKYDMDSISNEYGIYGSSYSQTSIFNKYSDFGSAYSQYSAFNKFASNPPKIVDNNGEFVAYLTDSTYEIYGVTYEELMVFLKKNYQ